MVYRKGERPLAKEVREYDSEHPVWRMVRDGDSWIEAWVAQMCTPWEVISRKTKIAMDRLEELCGGEEPTEAEMAALAELWWVTPEGLKQSIEDARPTLIARRERLASVDMDD